MKTTETIHVPAREGRAVTVPSGTLFRIVDVEGSQVADLFAFNAEDVGEHHSAMHTRAAVSRLFPRLGEAFVTNRRRPIFTLEQDDSPGVHDMLIAPCDPERYRASASRDGTRPAVRTSSWRCAAWDTTGSACRRRSTCS